MNFTTILLFIIGLIMLVKGGDWFVDGACGIARRFGLPELLIGATIVSIGTTLPEVMVSAGAAIAGSGDIAYGNAIGSIICNTALIAALTIAVRPGSIDRKSMITPVAFFFIAAAFYMLISYVTGRFSRWAGIALLSLFVIYILFTTYKMIKNAPKDIPDKTHPEEPRAKLPLGKEILLEIKGEHSSVIREILLLVIGAAVIAIGADFLVDSSITIANALGVPQTVISLTIVALGTSLPELVTAITSLVKGHSSLSVGNIIGANLLNIVFVSGVSVTISPFSVPTSATFFGNNASLVIDLPIMLGVMLILTVPALIRQKLSRSQGISLLLIYAAFLVIQFVFCVPAM